MSKDAKRREDGSHDGGSGSPDGRALRVERRGDDAAVLWFDVPGEKVNTLREGFEDEFEEALEELRDIDGLQAVALASGKESDWVAGADVSLFDRMETAEDARELSRLAQSVMDRVERFEVPIVAAIHGSCFGGGLELALACQGRVASDHLDTLLGQLEVDVGIIPGAGGTQRLPRLVGIEEALKMILTGDRVPARKAQKIHLVDEVVHPAILVDVALERSRRLSRGEKRPKVSLADGEDHDPSEGFRDRLRSLLLEDNPAGRKMLFRKSRERTLAKTKGNLPAPPRAIDVVETGIEEGWERGLEVEAEAFGELVVNDVARRLRELFFFRRELNKLPEVDTDEAREVRHAGVLGAGLMGSGIAAVTTVNAEVPVRMRDIENGLLREGMRSVREIAKDRVRSGRMWERDLEPAISRVTPTLDWTGFHRADVVIEAVLEDVELKEEMVGKVQEHGHDRTIFASNTSSIPIGRIAEGSDDPSRVAGMHYFSPVEKMPLLEVVAGEETAPWVLATCASLGKDQGKTVIVVNDGTGFYTTRILMPFLNEALWILEEGAPAEAIDAALTAAGFPVGPLQLADEVGLDVGREIGEIVRDAFGERMAPPPTVERLVEDGRKGKKNGRGFYRYEKKGEGWKRPDGDPVDEDVYELLDVEPSEDLHEEEEIAERCTLQMVNEAARCFGEGILRSARDGDVGAVFGLGFPAFRGGPLRMVDVDGPLKIVERLSHYHDLHGERFEPASILLRLAEEGVGFHDEGVAAGEGVVGEGARGEGVATGEETASGGGSG